MKSCSSLTGFEIDKYRQFLNSTQTTGTGSTTGVPAIDAAQAVWGFAKDIMSSLAVNETYAGVAGTIQDQALSNAVARQLRSFKGITVL